jgi:putative transcriptional regulator
MSKAGERLLRAAKEAVAYAEDTVDKTRYRVFIPDNMDVKGLRRSLHMTQEDLRGALGSSSRGFVIGNRGTPLPAAWNVPS